MFAVALYKYAFTTQGVLGLRPGVLSLLGSEPCQSAGRLKRLVGLGWHVSGAFRIAHLQCFSFALVARPEPCRNS